jgi:hypothetical protein
VSPRPDPESLVLDDLTEDERRALLGDLDPAEADATRRLADALSALEGDDWRNAETPALRFVPEGADRPASAPFWAGLRDRFATGPALTAGLAALVLLAGVAGFALRASTGPDGPSQAVLAEAKLQTAPAVSLVRGEAAPAEAGGVARMMADDVDRMMVRAHGLPAASGGRYYEVWLRDDAGKLVSVGRFRPQRDGTVDARFPMRLDPERFHTAIVTLQTPADGGAYSDRPVLRSPTT